MGDSLGGQSFIDRSPLSANRPCSDHCACGQLHHGAEKDDFTFTVRKTDSTIGIGLHSFALSSYIGRRLGLTSNKIDGFFLLKHITSLETQLQELRNDIQSHPPSGSWTDLIHEQDTQLEAELRLLVEGLLSDHQVFDSFGYENLYNKGILTHDRWKTFQGCKTAMAIDGLDSAFHAVDQAEADDDLETAVRSGLARSPMTRRDVPSTSSVQDNVLNFGSIDYAADRHAHWCLSMAADTSFCYCELLRKQNSSAKSAMFAAVAAGNLSHVDILLKASRQKHILYDVNDTSDGLTPLMVAVESGFVKIAQLLVNNGAFPNQSTKRGNAISAARERGFEDFTQFLLGAARVCPRQHKRHTRRSSCFSALDRYFRTPTTVLEPQRRSQSSGTDMRHKASISGIKLRYLHREFRRQHEQISAIAHASVRRVETQCREDTLRNFITAHLMVEPRGLFRIEWPLHTKYVATEEGQDGLRHPNPLEDKSGKSLDCNSTGSKQNRTKDDDHVYEPGLDDETATGIPKEQYAPRLGHVRSGREIEGHFVIDTDSKAWGHGFEHDYLKAWDRGIYVMRGLCRGEPPSSLRDTILFLEVARAMCLSKTNSDRSDFNLEFAADLGRWQVLFDSKESLSTFQTAVRDIWGISAEELSRVQTPDARSLEFFHELATSLVSSVEVSLDLQIERARGLLLSQQQWHANKQSAALEEPGGAPSLLQVPNAYGERREILVHELEDPATPYRRDRSHNYQPCIPPEDASYGDSEIRISSPIVLLLIPSFAFVMVIAFLLGMILATSPLNATALLMYI